MSAPPQVMEGAEAYSADGGPHGVLVCHGFTGNPHSMRGLAEAFAGAGFAVELPRLPGHGTTVEDMLDTRWEDWTAEVDAAHRRLSGRCERVVVAGLSMGGALTVWTALEHPDVAGIICINTPAAPTAGPTRELVSQLLEAGETVMDGIGSDIAAPGVVEIAYAETPLRPLLSLVEAGEELDARLPEITCPVLIMTSPDDHVVDPASSDHLAARVSGPVERVTLGRSYHVATLDHDKELVAERALAFAREVTAAEAAR